MADTPVVPNESRVAVSSCIVMVNGVETAQVTYSDGAVMSLAL